MKINSDGDNDICQYQNTTDYTVDRSEENKCDKCCGGVGYFTCTTWFSTIGVHQSTNEYTADRSEDYKCDKCGGGVTTCTCATWV